MTTRTLAAAVSLAAFLVALLAGAEPGAPVRSSLSVGDANDGRLVGGRRLPERGPGFYSNPHGPNREAKWGTDELVAAIVRAGQDVERQAPGATLYVNDLGFETGGPISHHESHQAGRDVDFLFYMNDERGKVVRPLGVRFDRAGRGIWTAGTPTDPSDDQRVVFDTPRNWLLVRSFVENREAHLQRVFVSEGLRALLLEEAVRAGEPGWLVERAADLMCEPRTPHDDHFHVRLFCTAADYARGCRDTWPLYPWRRTELASSGLLDPELRVMRPALARRRAKRPPRRHSPGRTWCP